MIGPETDLARGAAAILGEPLSERQRASFRVYLDLVEEWNLVHRLVGSSDRAWLVKNVILDSLLFLRVLPRRFESILDIGSGAGVPGIPIKIMREDVSLVMVESRGRRASFLESAIRTVGLTRSRVIHGRAECLIDDPARFDAVVSRCAGDPSDILDLAARLVTETGMVVIAGSPTAKGFRGARAVNVSNPATGRSRSLIVRSAPIHDTT